MLDALQNSVAGRIAEEAAEGFQEGWGNRQLGLGPETVQALRDWNVFSNPNHTATIAHTFNEVFIGGGAQLIDGAMRGVAGTWNAGANTIGQTHDELGFTGGDRLARDLKAMPEAFAGMGRLMTSANRATAAARSGQLAEDAGIAARTAGQKIGDAVQEAGRYELKFDNAAAGMPGGIVRLQKNISSSELGVKLGSGGNKNVYAYGQDKAVGVLKEGIKPNTIAEELNTLGKLEQFGVPTVNAKAVAVDGRPGILMNRYAQGSKDVVRLVDKKIRTIGDSELLNKRSITDLEKIRDTMIKKQIKIDDLQFLIREDGRVVVADPIKVHPKTPPSENNLKMIRQLIQAANRNLGQF